VEVAAQAYAQAEAQAHGYGQVENLYGGLAVMIVGQTTVSSVQEGLKVEETGSIEYPIYFLELTNGRATECPYSTTSPLFLLGT
jgi:hypothetical protein